jgi:hypothetical protein
MAEPWNSNTLTHCQSFNPSSDRIDPADNLVTGNDRHMRMRKLTIDNVKIGPADAARGYPDANLSWTWLPIRQFSPFKGRFQPIQSHCVHAGFTGYSEKDSHPAASAIIDN